MHSAAAVIAVAFFVISVEKGRRESRQLPSLPSLLVCGGEMSGDEERGVAVAEETVVGCEGVVVDAVPVVADECPDEEEEGAVRLVEIGDESLDDLVGVAGLNHDLRLAVELVGLGVVEVAYDGVESIGDGVGGREIVGIPLPETVGNVLTLKEFDSEPVEAFERSDGCCADGNDGRLVGCEAGEDVASDDDVLGVHDMVFDLLSLYGLESASADVEGYGEDVVAVGLDVGENLGGEVESSRGSCYGAFVLAVDGLVARLVDGFSLAVEVWWDWHDAGSLDDLSEREVVWPLEEDFGGVAVLREAGSGESDVACGGMDVGREGAVFPTFGVADDAFPLACGSDCESLLDFGWEGRLKAEDFDGGACGFMEAESSADDLGVVADEERAVGEEGRDVAEVVVGYLTVAIEQEF